MIAAMDALGNPSSVHAEGRAAKAIIEKARQQIADAVGASGADIVFTASATEAAALALQGRDLAGSAIEHDAVRAYAAARLPVSRFGAVTVPEPRRATLQLANSETGVMQTLPSGLAVSDFTQAFGKVPVSFAWSGVEMALVSAHKLGGPKGVGALIVQQGVDVEALIRGGGQEMGRRSGTENVIGIAGFGAAAEAAQRDLETGVWSRVEEFRNILEISLDHVSEDIILVGRDAPRLPNTSCFIAPGWKGETQVMQMDLAGFAVSAGSACSSGKVKASGVLTAMGFDVAQASQAIRVSIGPATTEEDINRFADTWATKYQKIRARAA